jgi:hypothetical protein
MEKAGMYQDVRDGDLETMSRERLIDEVKTLRAGIRAHRDADRHALCWHHPGLWGLLPEKTDPVPTIPAWPQFMEGCVRYRRSLDERAGASPRTSEGYGDGAGIGDGECRGS